MGQRDCAVCELTSDLVLESTDLYGVINILLECVITQLGANAADVLLYDAPIQKLVYVRGRGFRSRDFENSPVRLGDALAGQVARARRTVYIRDLAKVKEALSGTGLVSEGFVSYVGVPLVVKDELKGVLELFQRTELKSTSAWLQAVGEVAASAALALNNALLIRRWQHSTRENMRACDEALAGWARALEFRDYEPQGHALRVAEMTVQFAFVMGMSEAELVHVRRGALLHDIGKIGIPDEILLKPGALTDDEWGIMRLHPTMAYEQLSSIEFLRPALAIPYCHHEMWDGSGYPRGLKGEEIPLEARLFAIVDVWDTLRAERPYRKAWPKSRVIEHIRDRGGKHFEQRLADLFLKLVEDEKLKRKQGDSDQESTHIYDVKTLNV